MRKFSIALVFAPLFTFAQYEFYNGGDVYAQAGALVHVQGNFVNATDSSSYQNDGILELQGNFVNSGNASFTINKGSNSMDRAVKFIGTGKQTISGNLNIPGGQSLYNVVIDQETVADTVEMQTNTTMEGSLVFGHSNTTTTYNPSVSGTTNGNYGLLKTYVSNSDTTQQYVLNISNGDTDAIAGYPALAMNGSPSTGFILTQGSRGNEGGGLQRNITDAQGYVYPIGTTEHGYNAACLHFTSIPGGSQNVIGKFCDGTSNSTGYVGSISQYCANCDNANYSIPDNSGYNRFFAQDPCNNDNPQWVILQETIKNHGYWSITSTTDNSAYQYWLEVFPNSFTDQGNDFDTWRLLKYHQPGNTAALSEYGFDPSTSDWTAQIESSISGVEDLLTYTKNTGCYSGNGVPGGLYTGFSHFSMFSSQISNALPVQLLSLTATPENTQYIHVAWSTALEINDAGFDLMRSTDGVNFTQIAWLNGHDNSTVEQSYTYDDQNVNPDVTYYYQLKQIDNNGNAKESYIVSASLTGGGNFVVSDFIPNPAKDQSKINVISPVSQNIEVKFFDMLGRQLSSHDYTVNAGDNAVYFDVQGLGDATYTAVVFAENKTFTKKLVINRN